MYGKLLRLRARSAVSIISRTRKDFSHLDEFEEWRGWKDWQTTQVGGTAAGTAWLPFKKDLDPDPEGDPGQVGRTETLRPTRSRLERALVDPNVLVKEVADSLPQNSMLLHADFFEVAQLVRLKELFEAGVHLGHKIGGLNPKMSRYLFGERLGVCVFDLQKTAEHLKLALNFVAHMAYRSATILFVGNSRDRMHDIEKTAVACGEYAHTRKWIPGTFLNSTQMFGTEIRLPDLVIMANTLTSVFEEHPAVVESSKLNIPIVALVDSNCDPSLITYPVPGNDDSMASVNLFLNLSKRAILIGKSLRDSETDGSILSESVKIEEVNKEKPVDYMDRLAKVMKQ